MPSMSLPVKFPMRRARVSPIEVARAMRAMREERRSVEHQTGTLTAECWLCFDAVWGESVEHAYQKLTEHIQVRHPEAVK